MKHLTYFASIAFIITLCSCNQIPKNAKQTLELAGENKIELQKVIDHYQKPEDSLKLKAAYFLIGNMEHHFSYDTTYIKHYRKIFKIRDSLSKGDFSKDIQTDMIKNKWKKIQSQYPINQFVYNRNVNFDFQELKSDLLISNIDNAYKVWKENPYSDSILLQDFYDYILPYKTKQGESPGQWRASFIDNHLNWLKSVYPMDITMVFDSILYKYRTFKHANSEDNPLISANNYPYIIHSDKVLSKRGLCEDRCHFNAKLFTSLGFLAAIDFVPAWGNRDRNHSWNSLIFNGKTYAFEPFWDPNRWKYKTLYNNIDKDTLWGKFKLPKVFRKTFTTHFVGPTKDQKVNIENIPPLFRDIRKTDVSEEYFDTVDVTLELLPLPKETYYAYLCVFNRGKWTPVQWGKIKDGLVTFKKMGKGIVYMATYCKGQNHTPASFPVIVNNKGKIKTIVPKKSEQKMLLKRKFKPNYWFMTQMLGGEFQAANTRSFKDKVSLHKIKDTLELVYNHLSIKNHNKYRYVRYVFPKRRYTSIAKMSFFSKNEFELEGEVIAAKNISSDSDLNNVFDDDIFSSFSFNDDIFNTLSFDDDVFNSFLLNDDIENLWIGLDFGSKKELSKISFLPKTDKNDVWPKLNYELFYWDNEWVSLGTKKAETYSLTYESPISNALYLLKCLDEGKEERIFTYENGKQIWW